MYDSTGFKIDFPAPYVLAEVKEGVLIDAECGFPYRYDDGDLYDWAGNEIVLTPSDRERLAKLFT